LQRDFYEGNSEWAIAGRLEKEMREISRLVEGTGYSEAAAKSTWFRGAETEP
jgi:hypothetical protein